MRTIFYFITGLAFLFSCNAGNKNAFPQPKFKAEHGFYYWQTSWNRNARDSVFPKLGVSHMYIRMFDVDWDEQVNRPVPVSPMEYDNEFGGFYNVESVIPVIYITNKTFRHMNDSTAENLAQLIYQKLRIIFYKANYGRQTEEPGYYFDEYEYGEPDPYHIKNQKIGRKKIFNLDSLVDSQLAKFKEIQFDCDWTPSTKDKYFKFLAACRKRFEGKTISATIRLYPYKYQKEMGIPPVDRGMLMCYNVGKVTDPYGINSIFDLKEIRKYLSKEINYPLVLDYALPVFSWAAVYRNDKLVDLLDPELIRSRPEDFLLSKTQASDTTIRMYQVSKAIYSSDAILHAGDLVRVESVNYKDVHELAQELGSKNKNKKPRVILYHLNENNLERDEKQIQRIFSAF